MKNKKQNFLDFTVDVKAAVPVYEQVKRAIKFAILSDHLKEGDKLMSLRELSMKLQINPNTIIKVYSQLENDGYIYSRPGAGYFVKLDKEKVKTGKYRLLDEETFEYVSKVSELGFSMADIIAAIKKRMTTATHKES
ncbi:MAG: GntR family transcriptional regulator [Candidatus Aminicenantes bacterium]|nr:GntR family transcriptional regulator [Candidatus Aminicenantes bacterium]